MRLDCVWGRTSWQPPEGEHRFTAGILPPGRHSWMSLPIPQAQSPWREATAFLQYAALSVLAREASCCLLPVTLSLVSRAEQGMPGGGLSVRETPLLLVSAACGFGVSSSHPIQLFLWDPAPAQRCLPFSRVLQSRRHTLPVPLCSPRQPQNTRPGHSPVRPRSSPAAAGRERVLPLPAGAQSNALPKISSSTRTFHIFSGSLFPLAGRAASFWEDSQALAWRSAKGGTGRRGAKVLGQEGSPSFLRRPGSQRSKLCSWELWERSGHLSEPEAGAPAVRWSPWGH